MSRNVSETFLALTTSAPAWAEAGGIAGVRSVLPDLLIGAHAQHHAGRLFTLNPLDFTDFPGLVVETL